MSPNEIKNIRDKLFLSQEGMAHALGVSYATFSRWERGLSKPSPLAMEKLIKIKKEHAII